MHTMTTPDVATTSRTEQLVESFMQPIAEREPDMPEYLQAVREVARYVLPIEKRSATYTHARVLERLTEPDRTIEFRITWQNDAGGVEINRGWRVQNSNAIGPYKGGLRFHPTVTPSVLRFLAFEQTFKNALTGLPLGGAKGGSDFDPKGRSEFEIMRFCQAFMMELYRHIGPDVDVPAGDINVGQREIGFLFGAYKKICNSFGGAMTGKGLSYGGSEMRVEATGYGLIHFTEAMLKRTGVSLAGQRVAISGAGNVASHAAECAILDEAVVVTLSDSHGTLECPDGLTIDDLRAIRELKNEGGTLAHYEQRGAGRRFHEGLKPWSLVSCGIALPCATQNEVDENDVQALVNGGCRLIAEGANMPLTAAAQRAVDHAGLSYAPGKASNAGGVAMSGLEMMQNAQNRPLPRALLHDDLRQIMCNIHDKCVAEGEVDGRVDYVRGANVAGYRVLADAICALGI